MEKIKKEQEIVEERIRKKQEMQKKIDLTVKGIITMQDGEVEAFAKTCRSENPFKNVYEQEKTNSSNFKKEELLKKALHQDKPYML
jgi:fatty acid-binding protein DegV